MFKKTPVVVLFCLSLVAGSVRAQVAPSATSGQFSITVGGIGSMFQPDYIGGTSAQSNGLSLIHGIDGLGIFADVKFRRWVQIEGEARWLRFNLKSVPQYVPPMGKSVSVLEVGQTSYMVGPRIPLWRFGRTSPYAKALIGLGETGFNSATSTTSNPYRQLAFAFGGGLDYRISRRIHIRACDVEFQQWDMSVTQKYQDATIPPKAFSFPIHPYGVSAGISYKLF